MRNLSLIHIYTKHDTIFKALNIENTQNTKTYTTTTHNNTTLKDQRPTNPVSYTHLDVYKRQQQTTIITSSSQHTNTSPETRWRRLKMGEQDLPKHVPKGKKIHLEVNLVIN